MKVSGITAISHIYRHIMFNYNMMFCREGSGSGRRGGEAGGGEGTRGKWKGVLTPFKPTICNISFNLDK